MRSFAIHTKFAALAVALVAASVLGAHAQGNPVSAKVRSVRGTAKYTDNGTWHNLKVNDVINAGNVIETGPESTVDLFINNSVIRITPETTFGLNKAIATETGNETATETEVYLKSGRILGNVKKLAATSKYQIKTPNGVTGIRGTALDIKYLPGPNGMMLTVTSIEGTLLGSAANSKGVIKTAVINTGESWSPDEDIEILPEPVLDGLRAEVPPFDPDVDPVAPIPQPDPTVDFVSPK
jgi:hypothetical protein